MKRLLIPLLVLLCFTAVAQTPFVPQFKRKIPNDSIAIVGIGSTNLSFKLPDTSWVKKYTSTYFVHNLFVGLGTFSDPFNIAPNAIKLSMISATGTRNGTTFLAGDSTFKTISPGIWGAITGTLSDQTDLQSALNAKVPTSRTLTINGVVHDLSADRSWTVAGGVAHANNGLSLSGDTVQLGGDLTQTLTKVTVKTDQHLSIGDYDNGNGLNLQRNSDSSMFAALEGGDKTGNITGSFYASTFGAVIEGDNGSVVKSIRIDPTPTTGGMSIHDSDHLGLANTADYSTQIKLHPYALVQTNMLNARADSIISAVGGGLRHAANGLHLSGDTVKLGGNITEYTPITIAPNKGLGIGDPLASTNGLNVSRLSDSSMNVNIQGGSYVNPLLYGYVAINQGGNIELHAVNGSVNRIIDIDPTPSTGGITITDSEHKGLVGSEIFPVYSGKQYAQYHGVDSIAKAKADSVKGTISSGVSTFNSRAGAITLLSSDVTSALGFTPENVANKATSFGTINNTLYPSVQAVNTQLGNYVPLVGGVTITGEVQDSYTPLIANDLARLTDLGLVPTILTGMTVTVSGTTATIASGTYRLNNITYSYAGGTITIPAQDATKYSYSILYITTVGVISITNGALVAADPVVPDFPANSVEVSIIYIPPTGSTVTTGGGGSKSTGTVTVFSFVNANGFIGSVANATTKPALTLTLKTILPSVVAQTGLGTAGTDSVMVKHSGLMQAIAPGYYLAATTASSTYVPLTRTVNGKALSSNITLGLASSDFANQGTTTGLLHGNAAGNPAFGQIVNADITNATIDLTTKVTGLLPVANGGTGTSTPGIVAGTNITVSGTWPNQTINASGGSFTNPMTTTGDIIYSSSGSTPERLGIGSTNQILTVSGGLPSWQPQSVIGTSSATASTIMARDSNANSAINNLTQGYTAITATGGTTTLTASSTYSQVITAGFFNQTIVLPVTATLSVGYKFSISILNGFTAFVQSSGGNAIATVQGVGATVIFTCVSTSGTGAASWFASAVNAPGSNQQVMYNSAGSLAGSNNLIFSVTGGPSSTGQLTVTGNIIATKGYTDNNGIGLYTITGGNSVLQGYHAIQLGGTTAATSGLSSVGTGVDDYTVVIPVGAVGAAGLGILGKASQTANYFEVTTAANKATTHGDVFKIASDGTSKFFFPLTTNGTINKLTPSAVNTTATLTVTQMATGYITSTSAAPVTMTTATATALATQLGAVQGTWYDLTIDNTSGASTVTLALGSGFTQLTGVSSSLTVPTGTTGIGTWRINFVSTTAATIARIE